MLKFKILICLLILSIVNNSAGFTQSFEKELVRADSLYEKKQYIGAIKIYNKIYKEGKSSPAMLLKLARIEEGMGNIGNSIYFLEKYFRQTKDEKALDFLKETTEKKNAIGFDYDFGYKADLFYKEWKIYLQLFLSIIVMFGLGMMIKYINSTTKKRNYFAVALIPILLVAFLNNYEGRSDAITIGQPSFLLEGPSAGANLIEKINVPTKVQVKNQIDVWSQVVFEDEVAYIKTSQIKRL